MFSTPPKTFFVLQSHLFCCLEIISILAGLKFCHLVIKEFSYFIGYELMTDQLTLYHTTSVLIALKDKALKTLWVKDPCLLGVLLSSTLHNILSSHWPLSQITIVEIMDSSETGMNHVAMTLINPQKEYWLSKGSNQRPPVLKSCSLQTELWDLAKSLLELQWNLYTSKFRGYS